MIVVDLRHVGTTAWLSEVLKISVRTSVSCVLLLLLLLLLLKDLPLKTGHFGQRVRMRVENNFSTFFQCIIIYFFVQKKKKKTLLKF